MKEKLTIFENARFGQIRTSIGASGEPLFCLADVCKALDLGNPSQVKQRLQKNGVISNEVIDSMNRPQQLNFITEPNLYKCIFQSRKKEAEQFQDWVCGEVLPSIRKSGGYIATQQDDTPEQIMARAVVIAQDTIARKEQQISFLQQQNALQADQLKAQAPKVQYVDEVLQSQSTYCTNLIAKELGMSAKTLNQKLQAKGVIYKQGGTWVLHHKYQDKDYTKTRTHSFTRADGTIGTAMQTVYTERGRAFIHSIFAKP